MPLKNSGTLRDECRLCLKAHFASLLWLIGNCHTEYARRVFKEGIFQLRISAVRISSSEFLAFTFAFLLLLSPAMAADGPHADSGIRFSCAPDQVSRLHDEVHAYLAQLGIAESLIVKQVDQAAGLITYTLNTRKQDSTTLDFKDRPEFGIGTEVVSLPSRDGRPRTVDTVSKKEILLALMQNGRLTDFDSETCDINALKEHVGLRQNIVAWTETLEFGWPDGGSAAWNEVYWHQGTPVAGRPLHEALNDVFMNQDKYTIGCYAAARLVVMQGVIDYYARVAKDPAKLKLAQDRLMADGEPLVGVEPGKIWAFETDAGPELLSRPGKILKVQQGVAPKNFVPGDWSYFLNTDPATYQKTGYEGANAIYLGRNRFSDYYNDHDHSYAYEEKLHEVYQWRNGVFSRSQDADKVKPLHPQDFDRLSRTPEDDGLVLDSRLFPYFFGYEELP